jgi:pimeloyl-ACP methyl ester carboxylesterase
MLPLHLCKKHEQLLEENWSKGPAEDYSKTSAYKLLAEDPNARVVVNCGLIRCNIQYVPVLTFLLVHGNALHLGSMVRPEMYRMALGISTPENPVHVFALDYRGYGNSTGSPTEEGLITDGLTLLNKLTSAPLSIPPSRIVISGLSLGTAVTSAVAERFAFGAPESAVIQPALKDPEPFAGIILLASFSNLRSLVGSYSFFGLTPPMLSPLIGYPQVQEWVLSRIADTWKSSSRLARLTGLESHNTESDARHAEKGVDITIIHARNDKEIPWREGFTNWKSATGIKSPNDELTEGKIIHKRVAEHGLTETKVWEKEIPSAYSKTKQVKRVRWEKVGFGGHDRVGTYSVAALAILRSFEE